MDTKDVVVLHTVDDLPGWRAVLHSDGFQFRIYNEKGEYLANYAPQINGLVYIRHNHFKDRGNSIASGSVEHFADAAQAMRWVFLKTQKPIK